MGGKAIDLTIGFRGVPGGGVWGPLGGTLIYNERNPIEGGLIDPPRWGDGAPRGPWVGPGAPGGPQGAPGAPGGPRGPWGPQGPPGSPRGVSALWQVGQCVSI